VEEEQDDDEEEQEVLLPFVLIWILPVFPRLDPIPLY
jgi:hypothetical protein